MTDTGLDISDINRIKSVFEKHPQIEQVLLYGSRAIGRYKPHSDIDLSLVGATIDLSLLQQIELELDDLLLPYKFDVSIYHTITNPEFKNHIDRVGREFYTRDGYNINYQQILNVLLPYHKSLLHFDYKLAVDWAIHLLEIGNTDKKILMLASFSEPIDSFEIQPYVTAALASKEIKEKDGDFGILALTGYYLANLLNNNLVRQNLSIINNLYFKYDCPDELLEFYLLYNAWKDFDHNFSFSYYYDEATPENIEAIVKKQARLWIDKYIIPAQ